MCDTCIFAGILASQENLIVSVPWCQFLKSTVRSCALWHLTPCFWHIMSRSSKSSLHPSGCLVSHFMSYYVIVSQSPVEACNVSCNITKLWQKPHQSHSQGHQNLQAPMMTVYGGLWLTRSRTSNPHLAEQWHARYAVTLRSISNNFENRILWFASLRRLLCTHPDWRQTRDNLHQ